jgi:hypothetical protein
MQERDADPYDTHPTLAERVADEKHEHEAPVLERGWRVEAPPGYPVALVKGSFRVEPFGLGDALTTGVLSQDA